MNKQRFIFWRNLRNEPLTDSFSRNPEYHAFFKRCNDVFEFRFANGKESYLGNGIFQNVWKYENGEIIPAENEFVADVAYQFNKIADNTFDNAIPVCNTTEFRNWCGDKWSQYQLLKDYMPKTFLIEKIEDIKHGLENISTMKAVLKPRRGQKGENVVVFEKESIPEIDLQIVQTKGYLLQEFSDTNIVVPNVVTGLHDIKLITIDDSVFANLRTPDAEGKEFCTYDSPYTEIPIDALSPEIIAFHKKIKEIVDLRFPNQIYTIDMGITKNGPVVFELNGHTAFPYVHFDYAESFFESMIKHFQSLIKK
jgi:glutathione synthase/RimK-type ligase-like ATP-grasp enzyme